MIWIKQKKIISMGPKDLSAPAHFNIKPKAQAEEEKRPRMTKESPKLLGGIAEDCPVLDEPMSWKERAAHHPKQLSQSSQTKGLT